MRTLTLGVLIVAGGTLAALPFRRYQAIPDASSNPIHVTGPTQSDLTPNPIHHLAEATSPRPNELTLEEISSDVLAASTNLAPNLPRWQARSPEQPKRSVDIPLTFEDLATPIVRPAVVQQRFNATASARDQQLIDERSVGIVMPKNGILGRFRFADSNA